MRNLRSLLVFLILFVAVFFLSELLLTKLFEEDWVLWKTLTISFISAIGFIYPLHRKGLKPADILKYSYTCQENPQLSLEDWHSSLEKLFSSRDFKLRLQAKKQSIRIRRKPNRRSFGEVIRVKLQSDKVCIFSRPAYWFDLFDNGECYISRQKIKSFLKQSLETTTLK
jgi:hypothetical protein